MATLEERNRIEEAGGIVTNSFYDVFDNDITEEKLREYKRLIGMPLAESYYELIESSK